MSSTDPSSDQQTLSLQQALELALQHHTAGDLAKAEKIYQKILETDPNQAEALHLLGVIAHQKGNNDIAVDLITKALSVKPDYAEAFSNLGLSFQELGNMEEAIMNFNKALTIKPDFAEAHYNLGNTYQDLEVLDEAIACYHKAFAINPDYTEAYNNLGIAFEDNGQLDEAVTCCQKALSIKPDYPEAYYNLGNTFSKLGRLDEAVISHQKAITIKPDFAEAHNNLGNTFKGLGQLDKAVASYHKALAIKPDHARAGINHLLVLLCVPGLTPEELFNESLRFSENHTRDIVLPAEDLTNDPSPDRRLRVGYLSSDFRDHPVGRNIFPLLTSCDRKKFEVFCYAEVRRPDGITEMFRSSVDHWHTIVGKSDAEVAQMVRADGIDVLVCLAGRFDGNRPLVCAYRAAPVQVSYHDAATSGLEEMDYLLTDNFLNPPDTKEMFTEELHRLPVYQQYPPTEGAPPVTALPSAQTGFITFGSFNNPAKINEEVIHLWADVLKSVPGSRLLLKYKNWYSQASLHDSVVERFRARGVSQDRLMFATSLDSIKEHLGRYGEVDIALDPFPFNGAETTFQALWMGVPVISIAGATFLSRGAGGILHHGGLGELVVDTPEAYVACARDLAGDPARLEALRANLRERIVTSPLHNTSAHIRSVETAYREMWRKWCASQHPMT